MKDLLRNRWIKFGFWGLLYLIWIIWLGNYWWLFGLIIIFDNNITKKVKWAFWKKNYKEGEKHNVLLDWLDALIFAVIVVTFINMFFFQAYMIPSSSMEKTLMTGDYLFVSKLSYGPSVAQRPLTVPFTHNTLPITNSKSYSDLIKIKYRRLKGFTNVKRGDIVVFNFPHGDTVLTKCPMDDYYTLVRLNGKGYAEKKFGPIITRPVCKEDNYVKRCVAQSGDTLQVINGRVFINGYALKYFENIQNTYTVVTNGSRINPILLSDYDIDFNDFYFDANLPGYPDINLTNKAAEKVEKLANVVSCTKNIDIYPPDYPDSYLMLFPFKKEFKWTRDNYGPLYIPKKGATVELTIQTLPLYERLIQVYEGNKLRVDGDSIYVNDKLTNSYTFEQDYFFMMGDNRHNSLDSRYWGFVPEDHVVGKPRIIWFSKDKNKLFPRNIRFKRIFKFV